MGKRNNSNREDKNKSINNEYVEQLSQKMPQKGGNQAVEEKNEMNKNELEFTIFCIENIAIKLEINGREVYNLLTNKSDILDEYIIPNYEILHTQSKEYIVNDIVDYMKECGVIE